MSFLVSVKLSSENDENGLTLLINRLGTNPSFLNDEEIKHFVVYEGKEGDNLKVLKDLDFFYTISFIEPESKALDTPKKITPQTSKRKNESLSDNQLDFIEQDGEEEKNLSKNSNKSSQPSKRTKLDEIIPTEKPEPEVKAPENPSNTWEELDDGKLYIFTAKGVTSSSKIAGYDIDWTIITTKSGRVFPKDCDDWQIAFNEVPGKVKDMHKMGFKIVFFTNQAGVSKGKLKINDLKRKIQSIVAKLNVPIQVFISTGKGKYRKPVTGSWNILTQQKNDGIAIDMEQSFFCGDAAGRPEKKLPNKRKKDHSSADRLFALNIGLKFYTPEEHFQNKSAEDWVRPEFNPQTVKALPLVIPDNALIVNKTLEVVVMVGCPASGKSYFAKKHFESNGYAYINRDTLGTWQKCVAALENAVKSGKSAVVDNTNPDRESRKRYIDASRKHKAAVRCFLMQTSNKQARHNNVFREIINSSHVVVSDLVFNGYNSKFQEPTLKEGFEQIVRVNFVPEFNDPEHEALYKLYLLDK